MQSYSNNDLICFNKTDEKYLGATVNADAELIQGIRSEVKSHTCSSILNGFVSVATYWRCVRIEDEIKWNGSEYNRPTRTGVEIIQRIVGPHELWFFIFTY